jgi:hypothetical protein
MADIKLKIVVDTTEFDLFLQRLAAMQQQFSGFWQQQAQQMQQAMQQATGQQGAAPTTPATPSPGPAQLWPPGGTRGGGAGWGLLGTAARFLWNFGRGFAGFSVLAGGGYVAGHLIKQLLEGEARREASISDLSRTLGPNMYGALNAFTMQGPGRFAGGYSKEEYQEFLANYLPAAGGRNLGVRGGTQYAQGVMNVARSVFGLQPGEAGELFGGIGRYTGGQNLKQFEEMLASAFSKGTMQGQLGEVLRSIREVLGEVSRNVALSNDQSLVVTQSMLGLATLLQKTNLGSFQGAGAISAIAGIAGAFRGTSLLNLPDLRRPIMGAVGFGLNWDLLKTESVLRTGIGALSQGKAPQSEFLQAMGGLLSQLKGFGPLADFIGEQFNIPFGGREALENAVNFMLKNPNYLSTKEGQARIKEMQKLFSPGDEERQERQKLRTKLTEVLEKLVPILPKLENVLNIILQHLAPPVGPPAPGIPSAFEDTGLFGPIMGLFGGPEMQYEAIKVLGGRAASGIGAGANEVWSDTRRGVEEAVQDIVTAINRVRDTQIDIIPDPHGPEGSYRLVVRNRRSGATSSKRRGMTK